MVVRYAALATTAACFNFPNGHFCLLSFVHHLFSYRRRHQAYAPSAYIRSISLNTAQFSGSARERCNAANDGIVRVVLRDGHVQTLQALGENVHDLGSDFADVRIL